MLSTLRIRHIGVIDDAMLEFGPGFTALTGETGAGKTMIVTGLTMLLGGRLDRGRTSGSSTVDGTLAMSGHDELAAALDELGAEEDDGEVLVVRRMTRDGRSRAQIGGVPVPIGTLSRLVGTAVTVHGQSDQQRLRDPDAQRIALDRFATAEVGPLVERHREIWSERTELTEQLTELDGLLAERERRGTALREALERIEQADPQPGEDDALRAELERLGNAEELRGAATQAVLALVGDDDGPAAGPLLDIAGEALGRAARTDTTLDPLVERLDAARLELSDLAAEMTRYAEEIDASPGRIEEANERLHELTVLVRDLGAMLPGADGPAEDISTLLETSRGAAIDLDRFEGAEQERATVAARLETLQGELDTAADALTEARTAAAEALSTAVQEELRHLEMPDATIRVDVSAQAHRSHGRDAVAILLAPHPGAEHLPVAQAASGGELSRVMLALEVALSSSRSDRTAAPVFVFDEIDAGIGGRAALAVGQRLARLARHAQVIVVTHLPQVAAHASTHLQIVKTSTEGVTSSTVETLDRPGRIRELARMLAGDAASDVALAHAEELLEDAREKTAGTKTAGTTTASTTARTGRRR
ncbi:DNA repair protein RecN [Brachybacterium alimentarium]|uniref:DNA repair protein RecN n=1 Tax=Brachybacterium alimentarium TaxID=47845 RepID=UPI000DF215DC|nr:DNA repair protein RecN [Brachybacterium alimentarium]RCS69782.1 DNA repair protein RecN [Brachybacterium alimentarium]RCS77843.1 DNA repair protein RecN [Brachybacterium alimentarium]RCS83794.1 DNA repair protein RecN [Brachybacterium alimentarium]RCS86803.1 DNA repair protein RecN [Brachybacterium alimentarium]